MAADTLTCQGTGGGGSLGNDGRAVWRMEVADLGGSTGLRGRRAGADRAGRRRYLPAWGAAPRGGAPCSFSAPPPMSTGPCFAHPPSTRAPPPPSTPPHATP